MMEDYHAAINSLLTARTRKFKLHTICSLQLLSWLNSYRARLGQLIQRTPCSSRKDELRVKSIQLRVVRDCDRLAEVLMQRYVVFRALQQNALVDRLIAGEEKWELPKDVRDAYDDADSNGHCSYKNVNTPAPASFFTLIDSSIETVGQKYNIAGKHLTKEVDIQLGNLENYTVALSILYDRVSFFGEGTEKKLLSGRRRYLGGGRRGANVPGIIDEDHADGDASDDGGGDEKDDVFELTDRQASAMALTHFKLAVDSSSSSSPTAPSPSAGRRQRQHAKRGFVVKDYFWLVAQVNNFELFQRYAMDVCKKLRTRYVVDVVDYERLQREFARVVVLFKRQAQRCAQYLVTLAIRNCRPVFDGLFTPRWAKEECGLIATLFRRLTGCLDRITDASVMASDSMAQMIFDQSVKRIGIEYMKEMLRKDVARLPLDDLKRALRRDMLHLMDMLDSGSSADKKVIEGLRKILSLYTLLSVPPDLKLLAYTVTELKVFLAATQRFSEEESVAMCQKLLECRHDLERSLRNEVEKGIKHGFSAEQLPEGEEILKSLRSDGSGVGGSEEKWRLKIEVLRGDNLAAKDGDTSDPYVVLTIRDTSNNSLFDVRTPKMSKTLDPVWNFSVVVQPEEVISKFHLVEVQVWDHDYLNYDDFMGTCSLTRTAILDEIRNCGIKNPDAEKGTATFELKLAKRATKDEEISGFVTLRIQHAKFASEAKVEEENILCDFKQQEEDVGSPATHTNASEDKRPSKGRGGMAASAAAVNPPLSQRHEKTKHKDLSKGDGDVKSNKATTTTTSTVNQPRNPQVRLQRVFKGGSLSKKARNVLMGDSWQKRYFEIRQDGSIAWGKGDRKDWKAAKITHVRVVREKGRNREFEFEVGVANQKPLVLRASDSKRFRLWMDYLDKVCTAYSLPKHGDTTVTD
eukprot:jgi/Bigna1/146714/aug1.120_g21422